MDRSDWQLKLVSDFRFIWASLVRLRFDSSARNKHGGGYNGQRRFPHSWNCSLDVGTSPNFSISTILLNSSRMIKMKGIVLLAYYFINEKKGRKRPVALCELPVIFVMKERVPRPLFGFSFQLKRKFKQSGFFRSEIGLYKRKLP